MRRLERLEAERQQIACRRPTRRGASRRRLREHQRRPVHIKEVGRVYVKPRSAHPSATLSRRRTEIDFFDSDEIRKKNLATASSDTVREPSNVNQKDIFFNFDSIKKERWYVWASFLKEYAVKIDRKIKNSRGTSNRNQPFRFQLNQSRKICKHIHISSLSFRYKIKNKNLEPYFLFLIQFSIISGFFSNVQYETKFYITNILMVQASRGTVNKSSLRS